MFAWVTSLLLLKYLYHTHIWLRSEFQVVLLDINSSASQHGYKYVDFLRVSWEFWLLNEGYCYNWYYQWISYFKTKYNHFSSNSSITFTKYSLGLPVNGLYTDRDLISLFFFYNILIFSLIRINWAFFLVVCAAGNVLATFILTYFGIIFLFRHCLLKYRVILSVLDPRKCECVKDYSLDFEHAYITTIYEHLQHLL
jgi:hypothetical protein